MSDHDGYEVGYGKPPKNTRWKKGQSGNPKGRPKKTKEFQSLIERELDATVTISEGGKPVRLTLRELIAKTVVRGAAKGDKQFFKVLQPKLEASVDEVEFTMEDDDRAILESFLHERSRELDDSAEVPDD
ncbi:MAG: DUF5681 domain-containing protein [Planctomycetota bacterium]